MCHSIFFGLLLGLLATRLAYRLRARHGGGCGGGADGQGGCGRSYRRWGGFGQHPFAHRGHPGQAPTGFGGTAVADVVSGLDLNTRQQEEAAPVFAQLRAQFGERGPRLQAALSALASERFDRERVLNLVAGAPAESAVALADGLEHLHTILIPEQREQLRVLLGQAPKAPQA